MMKLLLADLGCHEVKAVMIMIMVNVNLYSAVFTKSLMH